jgi:hypothetical protein
MGDILSNGGDVNQVIVGVVRIGLRIDRSHFEVASLARRAANEAVRLRAERGSFRAGADGRGGGEVARQGSRVDIRDIGVERDELAKNGDMGKCGSLTGRDDLIHAGTSRREVVHAAKHVFKLHGVTRLDDRERLGLDRSSGRPLDLVWYDE